MLPSGQRPEHREPSREDVLLGPHLPPKQRELSRKNVLLLGPYLSPKQRELSRKNVLL